MTFKDLKEGGTTKHAKALHDLICMMLRGSHIQQMPGADLANYIYNAGVALHNIPISLASDGVLKIRQLQEIDELDPSSTNGQWGPWVTTFCASIDQPLPEYQRPI